MFEIYELVKVKATDEEGVVLGIKPKLFDRSKFVCFVALKDKRKWIPIEKLAKI